MFFVEQQKSEEKRGPEMKANLTDPKNIDNFTAGRQYPQNITVKLKNFFQHFQHNMRSPCTEPLAAP